LGLEAGGYALLSEERVDAPMILGKIWRALKAQNNNLAN
jgi:hypothetical protein